MSRRSEKKRRRINEEHAKNIYNIAGEREGEMRGESTWMKSEIFLFIFIV